MSVRLSLLLIALMLSVVIALVLGRAAGVISWLTGAHPRGDPTRSSNIRRHPCHGGSSPDADLDCHGGFGLTLADLPATVSTDPTAADACT